MKNVKTALVAASFLLITFCHTFGQSIISGKVVDREGNPIPGVNVVNTTKNKGTISNVEGLFDIEGEPTDTYQFSFIGYEDKRIIGLQNQQVITLVENAQGAAEVVVVSAGVSPLSNYAGATLYYNFDDNSSLDNVVGAANVKIDEVGKFVSNKHFKLPLVGNIAKIGAVTDTTNLDKNIRQIAQSAQGISIGLAPTYIFNPDNSDGDFFRGWASASYKVNSFQGTGKDKANVTLNQLRISAGIEFEGWVFSGSKRPMHIGLEGFYSQFDADKYKEIFKESKSSIMSANLSIIFPINANMGFLILGTYSENTHPVYSGGLIFK